MIRISQNTAKVISPIIRGMAQAGTLARSEANAAASILHEASKMQQTNPADLKHKNVMLTTAQVAMRLGVCNRTVLIMNANGKLNGVRVTGSRKSLRFPESDVERFLNVEA